MNAKTSFFNRKIFTHNLYQGLPYLIFMSGILLLIGISGYNSGVLDLEYGTWSDLDAMSIMQNLISSNYCAVEVKILLAFYSFFCGMIVFRYLYNKKLCATIHALPLKRSCLFFTNVLSGFAMLVIPIFVSLVILAVYLAIKGCTFTYLAGLFLILVGFCLIFYALAVLSAMLTGHLFAAPIVYALFNFGFITSKAIITGVLNCFYFHNSGYDLDTKHTILTPFWHLYHYLQLKNTELFSIHFQEKGIQALILYGIVSLIILAISLLLYNRRSLETQGDPITAKKLQPIFLYIGTLLASSVTAAIIYSVLFDISNKLYADNNTLTILIFLFIICSVLVYYVITMLLRKTIHVFHGNYKGITLYCCIALVIFLVVRLDVFHIETKQPDKADITSIEFHINGTQMYITNKAMVEEILELHQLILNEKDTIIERSNDTYYGSFDTLTFVYNQKNDKSLVRQYLLPYVSLEETTDSSDDRIYEISTAAHAIFNNPQAMLDNLDKHTPDLESIYISEPWNETTTAIKEMNIIAADYGIVLEALKKDIEAGHLHYYVYTEETNNTLYTIDFCFQNKDYYYEYTNFSYNVSAECTNTLAVINELAKKYDFDSNQ